MTHLARRSVLVTGSNRSGTTWVGRMLCLSRELTYLHEPFNPGIWPRWMPEPVPYRNLYVCVDNETTFLAPVEAMIERRFPWRAQVGEVRSMRSAARLAGHGIAHRVGRVRRSATLLKDPIAVFSTEWLADRFNLDIVMMVRSPLAFAGSIKRLGWDFDFRQWTAQPALMRDHLAEFADEIHRAASAPPDLLDQAILSWNVTYNYVDRMRAAHPDWHIVHYEGLARSPIDGFGRLYRDLGLQFDARVASGVARHSDRSNRGDVPSGDKGGIRRDSASAIDTWRTRLTTDEVATVEERTRAVAARLGMVAGDAR